MKRVNRHKLSVWSGSIFFTLVTALFISCATEVTQQFPTDPEEALLKADELIKKGGYEEARQLLHDVKGRETSIKYAPLAQLKIAESYQEEDEPEIAVTEYKQFTELYPDSRFAPYAQYQTAMIYFSGIQGPDRGVGAARNALEEFRRLKALYPRNPYKDIIELNIKKCLNIIADYEFGVGIFYYKKGSYKAALGRFLGILETYEDYKSTEEALFYIALSYKGADDREGALKYSAILKETFPESRYVRELSKELSVNDDRP